MVYVIDGFTLVVDLGVGWSLRCDEPFFETKLRELKAESKKQNDKARQRLLNIQIYTMRSLEFQSYLAAAAAIK